MNKTFEVTFNGAVLAGQHDGSGETIIFLHAGLCDQRMWRPQMASLASSYRVISYDRRGFGNTETDDTSFSNVADLKRIIDEFGSDPVHLCGCSQGGLVALDFALTYPTSVRSLVLIASAVSGAPSPGGPQSPEVEALTEELDEAEDRGDIERANAIEARLWLDGPGQPDQRVAGNSRDLFLDMNGRALRHRELSAEEEQAPVWDRLSEIRQPALILWGDLDFDFMAERSRHLASVLPEATGRELAGAAHLVSMEQSDVVTDLIVKFLGTTG